MRFKNIKISKIDPNPKNPRGIEIAKQDTKLPLLKDSIKNFGILVPIVVVTRGEKFLLIDGERRFVAAQELGLDTIPAYINDNELDDEEILFNMFQIHHNREPWGPIQQCHALENLYRRISNRNDIRNIHQESAKIKATTEYLVRETGIEHRTAENRVFFLRWPVSLKKELYKNPTDAYWYICEIEAKIIIPALRNYPNYFEKVSVDKVREDLFRKLEEHTVRRATDVREVTNMMKANITSSEKRKKFLRLFKTLHQNRRMTYSEAKEDFTRIFPELKETPITPRRILNEMKKLINNVQSFNTNNLSKYKGASRASKKELLAIAQEASDILLDFVAQLKNEG